MKKSVFVPLIALLFTGQSLLADVPGLGYMFFKDSSMSSCLTYANKLLNSVELPDITEHPDRDRTAMKWPNALSTH